MDENKKGGLRPNSGRKPANDPKLPITVYVEKSVVEKNGGKIELAQRITDAIKSDFVENPVMRRVIENNKPKNKSRILSERTAIPTILEAANPLTPSDALTQEEQKLLDRVLILNQELANPPKNPIIGQSKWIALRKQELKEIQEKLNQK